MAPPLATAIALTYGWRWVFIACGVLGLLWIPLWLVTARKVPAAKVEVSPRTKTPAEILRAPMMWGFIAANLLAMTIYTFWTNWTTLYLINSFHLPLAVANTYAPAPHFAAYVGGLAGGWLSMYWMKRRAVAALSARRRACWICSVATLSTALVPMLPSPLLATAGISLSMFAMTAWSVNLYTMPLDAFGGARAAFAVSLLTCAYGVTQAAVSPMIGRVADQYGYGPVCLAFSLMPLIATLVLHVTAETAPSRLRLSNDAEAGA